MAGLAEMLRNGGPPPGPPMEPEPGDMTPPNGSEMSIEQAVAFMESKGLTPDDLPILIAAIQAIMAGQGGGEMPPEMPPEL